MRERGTVGAVDVEAVEREALAAVEAAGTPADLDEARIRYLGRRSDLKQALREVRDRETGMTLNAMRERIERAVADREVALRGAADEQARAVPFDPTLPGEPIPRGSYHLITQLRRRIEDVFLGLGYEIYDGREVDTVANNFEALNTPEAHPSRDPRDTFYVTENTVLRTHTSPSQVRAMRAKQPPLYLISLGRVFRRDTLDATHTPVFHQVEALAVDREITLADLRGTVEHMASALFGGDSAMRMRTSYFPFTEPSVEFDLTCFLCEGRGCPVCKHSGWIEMGGAGEVDPAVFEAVGYDPQEWQGFAFGFGIDRLAFLRHGVPDLRLFWENDIRFLEQF
jgi:phenylalanyl-tRNA synthetase alpha chain